MAIISPGTPTISLLIGAEKVVNKNSNRYKILF
jgi:hypothetical protein